MMDFNVLYNEFETCKIRMQNIVYSFGMQNVKRLEAEFWNSSYFAYCSD